MLAPSISVLMTAFNREKYIAESIESLLASSFTDFELIIVDDCSTDNTYNIALQYQHKDARIKLYKNEKNLGDYPNRNKAASYASGKYLKYLDSDDLISVEGLQHFYYAMQAHPQVAFALSHEKAYDTNENPIKSSAEIYNEYFGGKGILNCGPSFSIIKTAVFRKLNGFPEKRYIGDTAFWLLLAKCHPMAIVAPDLIHWRQHEGQEYNKGTTECDYVVLRYKMHCNNILDSESPISFYNRSKFLFNQHKLLVLNILKAYKASISRGNLLIKKLLTQSY